MARLDLAFILCCCRACLNGDQSTDESFYDILGVDRDASIDEIKRAYKRKSLDLHPDKVAQRGKVVTDEDKARFTKMKEAYEVLSDSHKRETYDAIGEKGMKWIDEPFSIDPKEMADNFANSSTLDRSKIFAIFLGIAIAILLLPILICLQIDGVFGENSSWAAVATPLWIWNVFMLFYHVRIIMMGPIEKPDHISEEEWMDPLPMSKRYSNAARFVSFVIFEVLAVLKLDGIILWKWFIVFFPIYIVEGFTLFKRITQAKKVIVTIDELESILGKDFSEVTDDEKDVLSVTYIIVPSKTCEQYLFAKAQQENARLDVIRICFRSLFVILLLIQLDSGVDWSWWLIFTPFFAMSCCLCCSHCQEYAEVQAQAAEKLGPDLGTDNATDYGAMEEGNSNEASANETISEEERAEIKNEVFQAGAKACTMCCSQSFFLILVILCLTKIQGASFSTLWIISPFLFMASVILCLLGCTIFCVAPIDGDDINMYQNMDQTVFATNPTSAGVVSPQPDQSVIPTQALSTDNQDVQITDKSNEKKDRKDKVPTEQIAVQKATPQPQVVDLLDDTNNNNNQNGIVAVAVADDQNVVGPTESEVDDLD